MEFLVLFSVVAPLLLAFAVFFLGRNHTHRLNALTVSVCFLELAAAVVMFVVSCSGSFQKVALSDVCGFGLTFEAGGFRSLYVLVTAFSWFISAVFTTDYMKNGENRARYAFFLLLTLSGTVGVFLSADLYTTFVFFEIMSFASYPWVAHEETDEAQQAATTYLVIAVISGLTALGGGARWRCAGNSGTTGCSCKCTYFRGTQRNAAGRGNLPFHRIRRQSRLLPSAYLAPESTRRRTRTRFCTSLRYFNQGWSLWHSGTLLQRYGW